MKSQFYFNFIFPNGHRCWTCFFLYLLTFCNSFAEKCLFISLAHFFIGASILRYLILLSSLYCLDISLLPGEHCLEEFFFSILYVIPYFVVSFSVQKLFNFVWSHLLVLDVVSCADRVQFRKTLCMLMISSFVYLIFQQSKCFYFDI